MEHATEASARARAAVDAFLRDGSSSDSDAKPRSEEDAAGAALLEARPNRLGLGATANTSMKIEGNDATERARARLERSLRVQRERKAAADDDAGVSSSDDELVSRTRVIGVKRRRRQRAPKQEAKKKASENGDTYMKTAMDEKKDEVMSPVTDRKGDGAVDEHKFSDAMEIAGSKRKRRKKRRVGYKKN